MDLILHLGLAKTGSTFLQQLFHHNRDGFRDAGLHYCSWPRDVAAHPAAFAALLGQFDESLRLVQEARASGCVRAVLSSENLAAMIFRPSLLVSYLQALRGAGAGAIRVVIFIRRQDELFWSLHDTISRSLFADPYQMFYEIMRCGYYSINETNIQSQAPYYCFCFDHNRIIGSVAENFLKNLAGVDLEVHDFDAAAAFPGDRLLTALGVMEKVRAYPGEALQNRRRPDAEIVSGHADAFARVVGDAAGRAMRDLIAGRVTVEAQARGRISAALRERFQPGNALLMQRFGPGPVS